MNPHVMARGIPVARPRLAPAARILPYLQEIDANAWYSNYGPLSRKLQSRLATHWGVDATEVSLLANGTAALTLALLASGAPPGSHCLMPSWTFAASAGAVRAAGLVPHFLDVDPATWALDPAATQALLESGTCPKIGAILVVAPFGAPLDLAAWDAVSAATGRPVIIDAAAAFDTLRADGPMRPGACPVIVSLHATKVFGIGEGGAVICRDPAWLDRIRRLSNFGFLGTREAALPGFNGKMSEYAAAVGLAGLDQWRNTRLRWDAATRHYALTLRGVGLTPGWGRGWVSSTLTVRWPVHHLHALDSLPARGVNTLSWWGPGCHAQPAYADCPRQPLPVTQALGRACIGLPFFQDLLPSQIDHVCRAVADGQAAAATHPKRLVLVS